jgi:uncharacterized RDD family membrane protein YckC
MTTAQPARQPTDPPAPAGLTARLTAKIVDTTITAAIGFVAYFMSALLYVRYASAETGWEFHPVTDQEAYVSLTLFLSVPLYRAATIAMTAWKGTTPGKKLLGIKVIGRSDPLPPTIVQAVVRWALPLIATVPLVDAFIRDIPELVNDWQAPALSGRVWWVWVALGWWLLVHASALWDRDRRGWPDKAAGTIVVKTLRQP